MTPPKGYVTITVPKALADRLNRMRKGERRPSVADCIEYLLRLTVW